MLFTVVLCVLMLITYIACIRKQMIYLISYNRAKKQGDFQSLVGTVCKLNDCETRSINGQNVKLSLPEYEFIYAGQKYWCNSVVMKNNVAVNDMSTIVYSSSAKKAWVIEDIDSIKKQLKSQIPVMIVFVALVITSELIFN